MSNTNSEYIVIADIDLPTSDELYRGNDINEASRLFKFHSTGLKNAKEMGRADEVYTSITLLIPQAQATENVRPDGYVAVARTLIDD